ncbi:MAG: signal peptidase I [Lachnospirales bacterium]
MNSDDFEKLDNNTEINNSNEGLNENEANNKPVKNKKENKVVAEILSWVKTIVLALILAYLITNFLIVNAIVPSASMETTVMTGDRLIANRLSYSFGKPERFDIVVFKYPDDESILYIKRIIGMPGETIEIKNGNVYIAGEEKPLRCDFVNGYMDTSDFLRYPATYKIPKMGDNIADYTGITNTSVYDKDGDGKFDEDCYFMMGDNRNNSSDSRFWANTYLSEDKIEGKAVFRYWPLNSIGTIG